MKSALEKTGLFSVFVFEDYSASTLNSRSIYLEHVDEANIFVCFVDNKDDITSPVLEEVERARAKNIPMLYFFCNEHKKKHTALQDELIDNQLEKYEIVNKFCDLANSAYKAILQDIVWIYRNRSKFRKKEDMGLLDIEYLETKNFPLCIHKKMFSSFKKTGSVLWDKILPQPCVQIEEKGSIDYKLSVYLKYVTKCQESYDDIKDELYDEIKKKQPVWMHKLLEYRFAAQYEYNNAKYETCLKYLGQALSEATNSNKIAEWLVNDIALDIRNISIKINDLSNIMDIDNVGQRYLDQSKESVYYPIVDRENEDFNERIIKYCFKMCNLSPYAVCQYDVREIFVCLANAFCIAEMFGSITQTEFVLRRLSDMYKAIIVIHKNHDLLVELIRILTILHDKESLEVILRTCDLINTIKDIDIRVIYGCTSYIRCKVDQLKSRFLLISKFGSCLNDDEYESIVMPLLEMALLYVRKENRIFSLDEYIFDFVSSNIYRLTYASVIDFISEALQSGGGGASVCSCFKIIDKFDMKKLTDKDIEKLVEIFKVSIETYSKIEFSEILSAFNHFVSKSDVELSLFATLPICKSGKYKEILDIACVQRQDKNLNEFVDKYINMAIFHNAEQGKNGTYTGYGIDPYLAIFEFGCDRNTMLTKVQISKVISVAIETLTLQTQTCKAKISAVTVLIMLYCKYGLDEAICGLLFDNKEKYFHCYIAELIEQDTQDILIFAYELLLNCIGAENTDSLKAVILSIDVLNSYRVLQYLTLLKRYVSFNVNNSRKADFLNAVMYFAISMTKHKERDVKCVAVQCLLELLQCDEMKELILRYLSGLMESSISEVRMLIGMRLKQLNLKGKYVDTILKKCAIDNNYLVRYVANREYEEC